MVLTKKDLSKAFSPRSRKVVSRQGRGAPPRLGSSFSSTSSVKSVGKSALTSRNGSGSANMKVIVRVRPPNRKELDSNCRQIIQVVDDKMLIFDPKEEDPSFFYHGSKQRGRDMMKKQNKHVQFLFDRVFGFDASNEDVFNGSTKNIISSVLDGFNCSVFVYGATGAGKTFTMLGTQENPGITFRTMVELFQQMESQKMEKDFDIGVSYLEVYNENVQDLICPSGPLHLREDTSGVVVAGLKMERISDPGRMFELLEQGNKHRTQHPTDANAESSRSHAVFQVYLKMTTKSTGQKKFVKLSMIDLAGSERGAATGCLGARFKEGSNINKSLLALGNCINALADGLRHIPYRDSKLTRLLKDSLGGNCQTVMIANVSPAASTKEDTHNTLKYATRAKKIKFKIKRNIVSVELHVSHYIKMVEDLQAENSHVKEENAKLKEEIEKLKSAPQIKIEHGHEPTVSDVEPSAKQCTSVAKTVAAITDEHSVARLVGTCNMGVNTSPYKVKVQNEELNRLVEQAQQLFAEKEQLQQRYLNMDSNEKVLKWRIDFKQRAANRVQQMSNTPERMEQAQARVDRSLGQFIGRLASANECQETISSEQSEIDHKLNCLKMEVKQLGLMEEFNKHLENMELKCMQQELAVQCHHLEKLVTLLDREREQQDSVLSEASAAFRYYYKLLCGHNHMTSEMKAQYQSIIRRLEGMKEVKFEDDNSTAAQNFNNSKSIHKITKLSFGAPSYDAFIRPALESESAGLKSSQPSPLAATTAESIKSGLFDAKPQLKSPPLRMLSPISSGSSVNAHELTEENSDLILQSPVCSEAVKVERSTTALQNMDTATMLSSLGELNNKVDDILNTTFSEANDENIFDKAASDVESVTQDFNVTYPKVTNSPFKLNVTFEAGDVLNATFDKDDLNTTFDAGGGLNKTYDKALGPSTDVLNGSFIASDQLNNTFSLKMSPVKTGQPPATTVSEAKCASSSLSMNATDLSGKVSFKVPSVLVSDAKSALPSSPSMGAHASSLKVPTKVPAIIVSGPNSVAVSSPPVSVAPSNHKVLTSALTARTGNVTNKSSTVANRLHAPPADRLKVLTSNLPSRLHPSSKLHGVNRKVVGAATKMVTTPSKLKMTLNKENRNTATSGGGSFTFVKPAPPTKFSSSIGCKAVSAKGRLPLSNAFAKSSPKYEDLLCERADWNN